MPSPVIQRIIDLDPFSLPLGLIFPEATLAVIEPYRDLLDPVHVDYAAGLVQLSVQSHLVRIGNTTILIDGCIGEDKPRPRRLDWHERRASGFLQRLAAAGCTPEDIDIVVCTHLHADHVGWNTRLDNGRWVPTFPNARYLMGKTELAYWADLAEKPSEHPVNHGSYADSVLPVLEAGQAIAVEGGHDVAPGAAIVPLPGHTPGHLGLAIVAKNKPRTLFTGDAMHSPLQVFHPGWSSAFCTDPLQSAATRVRVLAEAAETETVLIPAHLRGDAMRIRRRGSGYMPVFCRCDGH
jgi:glyoxylase-like metal-dependent hydrolase (beta-lactamase superfamily II)